jgi:hypothetical protein
MTTGGMLRAATRSLTLPLIMLRCAFACDFLCVKSNRASCFTEAGCMDCDYCVRPPPSPRPPINGALPTPVAEYWTVGSDIFTNAFQLVGKPLRIKGASWIGLESATCYLRGATQAPLSYYAIFLQTHGFNAVRVPLAADGVLGAPPSTSPSPL